MSRYPKIEATWLDKTISYFNPETGLKRLEARTRLSIAGGYKGAEEIEDKLKAGIQLMALLIMLHCLIYQLFEKDLVIYLEMLPWHAAP